MNEITGVKKLRRTQRGRIIAGVCSGIGEYTGIDANIIRIALAIASFFGGLGVGVYAIGWLLLPDENKDTSIVQDLINKQRADGTWGGNWHSATDQPPYGVPQQQQPYPPQAPYVAPEPSDAPAAPRSPEPPTGA
ncbi:phage shock protein PspC (stress-responsive transcriptional regulator) [Thermocatellispora tengchongensis]|uniref:Phage shock protein PspC (Stress-responsive transcriptional regulator) n=1 Tax=Thermocatellispora tengchongensis TaxID=1073253 RepID=A0A840PRK1_9ACTN|nr:PspC domain-containing protein [Thermocatellispora tengchongensis]MBB5138595.1 phage shock protein PspC (stress-responsive transcriptional regulator) [Thermocatellispora tengchongensis]